MRVLPWNLWFCFLRPKYISRTFSWEKSENVKRGEEIVKEELFDWKSAEGWVVKDPPATQKAWVWSLDQEDPLEEGIATHSIILAWKIPWTEKTGGLQTMGSQRVRHDFETEQLLKAESADYSAWHWLVQLVCSTVTCSLNMRSTFLRLWSSRKLKLALNYTKPYCISDSSIDYDGYSISLRDSCPQ